MKNRILKMLDSSPVNFLAAKYAEDRLNGAGFQKISLTAIPELIPGKGYYITKNNSAVFAFRVGTGSVDEGFKLICAHTDSPCFRVKPSPEMVSEGGMIRLNTEVYGGPILYTWFDRPLSLAGRVILRGESPLSPKVRLLHIKRPLLIIPHLAIHFNREVNEGNKINRQKDMMPVWRYLMMCIRVGVMYVWMRKDMLWKQPRKDRLVRMQQQVSIISKRLLFFLRWRKK